MKPKTKLFLSLLWRDCGVPMVDFYMGLLGPLGCIICVVLFLCQCMAWLDGCPTVLWLILPAISWASIYGLCGLYKWLKLRWDQLPDETP